MNIDLYAISDIVGMIGVMLIIVSFLLLQTEKLKPDSTLYLNFNLLGSLSLLFSLYFNWNLASVVIECLWLIITAYGIVRFKILRKKKVT
jgi:hypothetical protein